MEPILKDPRMKARIMNAMLNMLYARPLNRLAETRLRLVQRNDFAHGNGISGFCFKGEYYRDNRNVRRTIQVNRLMPELHAEMLEYLTEVSEEIPSEEIRTKGYIQKMLNASDNPADFMRLFPECLLPPVEKENRIHGSSLGLLSEPNIVLLLKETEEAKNIAMQRMVKNMLE